MAYRIVEITKPAECHVTKGQLELNDLPFSESDTTTIDD